MFARLLACVGLLALASFGLVGCGDEAPESSVETVPEDAVVRDAAELVKTRPASGEVAAEHTPLVLYFDKEPLAVTVNGTAARVEGKRAVWCFPNPTQKLGDQLFHIKWTNPDGSPNVGAYIRLRLVVAHLARASIMTGTVSPGDADVDPDPLNRDGIWFEYDEPVVGLKSELITEDGEDLGWEAVWWDDRTVTFRPGADGKLLENGKRYIIQIVVSERWTYSEFACDCMDCSYFKNLVWTIGFRIADE